MESPKELDRIKTKDSRIGTVLLVIDDGKAVVVEFSADESETETIELEDVQEVLPKSMPQPISMAEERNKLERLKELDRIKYKDGRIGTVMLIVGNGKGAVVEFGGTATSSELEDIETADTIEIVKSA